MASEQAKEIEGVCREAIRVVRERGRIFLFRNGGSAADAQHILVVSPCISRKLVGRLTARVPKGKPVQVLWIGDLLLRRPHS